MRRPKPLSAEELMRGAQISEEQLYRLVLAGKAVVSDRRSFMLAFERKRALTPMPRATLELVERARAKKRDQQLND